MSYLTNSDLVTHMSMHNSMETHKKHLYEHTGMKSYQCNQCDKTFLTHSDLEMHKHEHTGESTYQCNQCSKAFSIQSDMKKHMYEHTGEKPYQSSDFEKCNVNQSKGKIFQCTQCDKLFDKNVI